MAITKSELLTHISGEITVANTNLTNIMTSGSIDDDSMKTVSYCYKIKVLSDTKDWIESNL